MTRYLLVACIHSIDRIGSFGGKSLLPRKIWRERNLWEKEIEREGEIRYGGKFIGERYYGTNMLTRGSFRKARASVFCIDVIISSFSDCDILQSQRKFPRLSFVEFEVEVVKSTSATNAKKVEFLCYAVSAPDAKTKQIGSILW